jgi:hypothetical protein
MCDDLNSHITVQREALKAAVIDTMFYDGVLREELAAKLDEFNFAYELKEDGVEV